MAHNKILHILLVLTIVCVNTCTSQEYIIFKDTRNKQTKQAEYDVRPLAFNHSSENVNSSSYHPCPTWMVKSSTNDNNSCECGKTINAAVKCNTDLQQAFILDCHCMTYDTKHGPVIGSCFYSCAQSNGNQDLVYHALPKDPSQLNEQQCGHLNRDGRLCGSCKDGYSPLVYSYNIQCINCTNNSQQYNWVKYTAVGFIPLTLFYLFVVLFQFRANSPQLYAFVLVAQTITTPANLRVVLTNASYKEYHGIGFGVRLISTLFGIWNLDFFRTLYSNICLDITPIQALALDYTIAFYPLLLMLLSCVTIALHSRGVRIVVWMFKPFNSCITAFRQQTNSKTSMINVIATFLLLSYLKLLSVSSDLLLYTNVYDVNGTKVGRYLYYDASIEYFGREHLPYAILAVFVLFIFNLLPMLLLLLYPLKYFQRFLNSTHLRTRTMDTFIDTFQGCYKDGTEEGTRDLRYFSAFTFMIRIILLMVFASTYNSLYYALGMIAMLAFSVLYIVFKPYKSKFSMYNTVEAVLYLTLAMLHGAVVSINIAAIKNIQYVNLTHWMTCIITMVPLIYIVVITIAWVITHSKHGRKLVAHFRECRKIRSFSDSESQMSEGLPDRLLNPVQYQENSPLDHHDDGVHGDELLNGDTY